MGWNGMLKNHGEEQFDLFVPFVIDLPLARPGETMERPFFSLAKHKRLKPIDNTSPRGSTFCESAAALRFRCGDDRRWPELTNGPFL
jgi:hypothetical protein